MDDTHAHPTNWKRKMLLPLFLFVSLLLLAVEGMVELYPCICAREAPTELGVGEYMGGNNIWIGGIADVWEPVPTINWFDRMCGDEWEEHHKDNLEMYTFCYGLQYPGPTRPWTIEDAYWERDMILHPFEWGTCPPEVWDGGWGSAPDTVCTLSPRKMGEYWIKHRTDSPIVARGTSLVLPWGDILFPEEYLYS